ncbi:hypothetical protein ACLIMP_19070 [Novosphingobium aerophilum]|uniref:hypothetical protein n=1 Tax=Novosphingobium TaxID=165696 RepID=UPI002D79E1E6|nr:hypothetical protein [Novosphingobium sp. RL4]WRT95368.1 hypothetical protein U9J33_24650 [Novosphingobium sp. RL4]
MRTQLFIALLAATAASGANAQAPAAATIATAKAATPRYTTQDTDIGTLLDDPEARTVLEKYLPEIVKSDQIAMARGMTLRAIQQYSADQITDAKLAAIDADLAKLPPKK